MEQRQVKAMLAGQLRLLCERSERESGEVLAHMSEAMAALADVYLVTREGTGHKEARYMIRDDQLTIQVALRIYKQISTDRLNEAPNKRKEYFRQQIKEIERAEKAIKDFERCRQEIVRARAADNSIEDIVDEMLT